jgi:hypothetical protein
MGLSERDLRKNRIENGSIERDVQIVESNEGGDRKLDENKGAGICAERQQKP